MHAHGEVGRLRGPFARRAHAALRKLREGPGPWMRAAVNGVFELLPDVIRANLLRPTLLLPRGLHVDARVAADGEHDLVTVVLPVRDQARMLGESIASVLRQTWSDLELIVVDDGSTDDVPAVLAEFADDRRVRWLRQQNRGLARALSCGFTFARGEFWTWTSADNAMEPTQLERMVGRLRARPETAMVYADYRAIDPDGAPLQDPSFRPHNRCRRDPSRIRLPRTTRLLNVVPDNFIGPCFLYRSWVGRLLGDYGRALGIEDYDYWMRLNALFRIEHLHDPEPLYRYRCHGGSISARAAELRIRDHCQDLMQLEQRRARFFLQPFRASADADAAAWLRPLLGAHERLRECTTPAEVEAPVGKGLLWLAPEHLRWLRGRRVPSQTCVAVRFSGPFASWKHAAVLQRPCTIALADDEPTAARLRLFTSDVFVAPTPAAAVAIARAFADDRLFRRLEDVAIAPPLPISLTAGGPLRLLVLADDLDDAAGRAAARLASRLRRAGHTVAMFGPTGDGEAIAKLLAGGVEMPWLDGPPSQAGFARWLDERGFDVVSGHHALPFARVAAERGIPIVSNLHSTTLDARQRRQLLAASPHVSAHVLASPSVAEFADRELGIDFGRAVLVPATVARYRRSAAASPAPRIALREYELLFAWLRQGGSARAAAAALRRFHPPAAADAARPLAPRA